MKHITLITGGQRAGKSTYAEERALALAPDPVYLATSRIWDEEFQHRVNMHKQRRGSQWTNIEEDKFLSKHPLEGRVIVIDCVTLWCTNFFFDIQNGGIHSAQSEALHVQKVLELLKEEFDRFINQDATFIFVTNEIGSGGVSENDVQRRFTDLQGWMNQYIASKADEVIWMVSGIPVKVKEHK